MRSTLIFVAAGLLLTGTAASAQESAPTQSAFIPTAAQIAAPQGFTASFDAGTRFTDVDGDKYRFQRYRDFRNGLVLEQFRLDRQGAGWTFNASGERLGGDDRRLAAVFRNGSKVRVSFSWDQTPLLLSGDTRTLFTSEATGVFRLDDAMRSAIQAGRSSVSQFVGGARPLDLGSQRDTALFELAYNPTREVKVNLGVKHTRREGTYPQLAPFGFSDVTELVAPLDTRTTDVNGGIEWANARGMVRLGYEGSNFVNRVPTLVWDNPLKLTDSTASNNYSNGLGASRGRMAMPPDSRMQGISAAASAKLPANSRVTGNVTVGTWTQDAELLPVTINSAVPAAPLPRQTLEGNARTVAMNVGFTSQPSRAVFLSARFRSYEFDNRTPVFHTPISVVFDQVAHEGAETEPLSLTRYTFDADASFTPVPLTALRLGYSRNIDDRTFRIYERTAENVVRASVDSSAGFVTVRGIVERAQRRGSGFDEHLLVAVGEQVALRHYDVADRDRDRITALVQLVPVDAFGLTASASYGKDDYLNSYFGLRNNENNGYSITADFMPGSRMAAAVSYTNEKYTALQNSRYVQTPGSTQVTDPTRDWTTDGADRTKTIGISLDFPRMFPRVDVSLAYDDSRSRATYVYRVPATSTLVAPVQLPAITNDLKTALGDVRFHLSRQVAIGVVGWYDKYDVDDYARNAETLDRLDMPGTLLLGYVFRPYTARSAAVRIIWTW
ncbi:MAG TPA: MtrB/PioB family decaheme-associated outer membrane protein [Vicinamibacterales bacterium]|nr:MtrB/PioB family decaheme-associated outer membrane protein [Vicinamibacterales bacterium]